MYEVELLHLTCGVPGLRMREFPEASGFKYGIPQPGIVGWGRARHVLCLPLDAG